MAVDISFSEISKGLKDFRFPGFDVVVGIARGGIVPATLIAHQLGKDLKIMRINYRDDHNNPQHDTPVLISDERFLAGLNKQSKILLVDDVSVTGKTIQFAKELLKDYTVTTFALKGKADLALFTDIKSCVNWPWKVD